MSRTRNGGKPCEHKPRHRASMGRRRAVQEEKSRVSDAEAENANVYNCDHGCVLRAFFVLGQVISAMLLAMHRTRTNLPPVSHRVGHRVSQSAQAQGLDGNGECNDDGHSDDNDTTACLTKTTTITSAAAISSAAEGKRKQLVAAKFTQKESACNANLPKPHGAS